MQLPPNTYLQNGKYRILRVLGQGGFGITYLAENVFLNKNVAIKEFFPKDFCGRDNTSHLTLGTENNREIVAKLKDRFLKEARNITRLNHPGIIRIHDIFEENNTAYYVMDYIEGESLNDKVRRTGIIYEPKAIEYIIKVAEALEYIHSNNMTHFDVKPANIMVRTLDDEPVLIDFGLSKQYDAYGEATSTLLAAVSPGYSAAELYNNGAVQSFSPKVDVYSIAATLYFLVTGKVPPSALNLIYECLQFPLRTPNNIREIIETAMAVNQNDRTPDIKLFREQLSLDRGYIKYLKSKQLEVSEQFEEPDQFEESEQDEDLDELDYCGINNIRFVDLGLSVNWADRNIGAEHEEGIGFIFSRSDLSDITPSISEILPIAKYPTEDDYKELIEKCEWIWEDVNTDLSIYKIIGPNGSSITIPIYPKRIPDVNRKLLEFREKYWINPTIKGLNSFMDIKYNSLNIETLTKDDFALIRLVCPIGNHSESDNENTEIIG